ncbi:MAG: ferredoxin family protein [Anaerolineales bacterium]|nr:ferredoxin family protein [Alphaproteobacteria bacterium]MDP7643622.1 ferredoxin family protein [Anaerolineales bacterium]
MGIFINIEINAESLTAEQAALIPPACPVDIFKINGSHLEVQPEQEDECVLCELCLDLAPVGAITIRKSYKDELLASRAQRDGSE